MTRYEMTATGALRAKPPAKLPRIATDLAPEEARQRIAALMADGRERTSSDVAKRTGISQGQASAALGWLCERGLVTVEVLPGIGPSIRIYRKAGAA